MAKTVLIVEDDRNIADLLRLYLVWGVPCAVIYAVWGPGVWQAGEIGRAHV